MLTVKVVGAHSLSAMCVAWRGGGGGGSGSDKDPDGEWHLATGGRDKTIKIWDIGPSVSGFDKDSSGVSALKPITVLNSPGEYVL